MYPFDKDTSGRTLYAKQILIGAGPNAGTKTVAHNISGYDKTKMWKLEGFSTYNPGTNFQMMPYGGPGSSDTSFYMNSTNLIIYSGDDYSAWTMYARVLYAK